MLGVSAAGTAHARLVAPRLPTANSLRIAPRLPAALAMSAGAPRQRPVAARAAAGVGAAAGAASEDVQGEMLAPSLANRQWFRALALGAAIALLASNSASLGAQGVAALHLWAYGTWLGSLVYTTFVAGITLFKNLPRQTFGRVQSKLFPIYFGLSSGASALLLGLLRFAPLGGAPGTAPARELALLGVALAASLANWVALEPAATSSMFRRYALENAEGPRDEAAIKALAKRFGALHGVSSLLNLVVLVAAVGHGWWLAGRLAL